MPSSSSTWSYPTSSSSTRSSNTFFTDTSVGSNGSTVITRERKLPSKKKDHKQSKALGFMQYAAGKPPKANAIRKETIIYHGGDDDGSVRSASSMSSSGSSKRREQCYWVTSKGHSRGDSSSGSSKHQAFPSSPAGPRDGHFVPPRPPPPGPGPVPVQPRPPVMTMPHHPRPPPPPPPVFHQTYPLPPNRPPPPMNPVFAGPGPNAPMGPPPMFRRVQPMRPPPPY